MTQQTAGRDTTVDTNAAAGFTAVVALFVIIAIAAAIAAWMDVKDTTEAICGDVFDCDPRGSQIFRAMFEAAAPWSVGAVAAGIGRYIATARTR